MAYSKTEDPDSDPKAQTQANAGATVVRYHFHRAEGIAESQLKPLKGLSELFAKDLADAISTITRRRLVLNGVSLTQVEPLGIVAEVPNMPLRFLLELRPSGIRVLLGLDSHLVFALLEALLGGKKVQSTNPERDLTEVELSVLRDIDQVITQEFLKTWQAELGPSFGLGSRKTTLGPDHLDPFRDSLLFVCLDLSLDGKAGKIALVYPVDVVEAIGDTSARQTQASSSAEAESSARKVTFEGIRASQLVMEGCLRDSSVRLVDLMDLKAGDLLRLDSSVAQPIDIRLNGTSRFQAEFLGAGPKKAIRIRTVAAAE